MPSSIDKQAQGLTIFAIKINGAKVSEEMQVLSIKVERFLNKVACAKLVILDSNRSESSFSVSSSTNFVPGNKISIEAGYDSKTELIFEGVVTQQALRIEPDSGPALHVDCNDEAVKMTLGRKSACFKHTTDGDAISELIGLYSGLTAEVCNTSNKLPELLQYYTSDWDFILQRASVNGLLVNTNNGKVSVFSPAVKSPSILTIEYGNNLLKFSGELNAINQLSKVTASVWDYQTQQLKTESVLNDSSDASVAAGNLTSKKLSEVIGLDEYQLQTTAALDQKSLRSMATSELLKSQLCKIIGQVTIQGDNAVVPGSTVTLEGVGTRFSGNHFVSSVTQDISGGNWITDVGLGLPLSVWTTDSGVLSEKNTGAASGLQGLYNAKVKKIAGDPENEFRIQVDLPLFDPTGEGVWAKLSNFYSSTGAGAFFIPDVGDEVIVGFLNDDPRYPIILGSLYSNKIHPAAGLELTDKNNLKAIVTKRGLKLVFNDEDNSIVLSTANDNRIRLDEENKQINISDQHKNEIMMSSDGVSLRSPKSISIDANDKVIIKGKQGVKIESSQGDVETTAMNIKQTADIQYAAEGESSSLQGGAELTLKGALVNIN